MRYGVQIRVNGEFLAWGISFLYDFPAELRFMPDFKLGEGSPQDRTSHWESTAWIQSDARIRGATDKETLVVVQSTKGKQT